MRPIIGIAILYVLVLPLVILPISAQPTLVAKTWGGRFDDEGYGITIDALGNSFLTGYTQSFGTSNHGDISVFILKYDVNGSLVWQRTWGGLRIDMGHGIAVNSSGDIYVTGSSGSYGGVFLLKLNSSGNLLWQRTWGSGAGNAVALDSKGAVYVAGVTYGYENTAGDAFLLKVSSTGNLLWHRAWGGGNITQTASGVSVDGVGNVYVAGGGAGGFLVKVDPYGSLLWEKYWGGSRNDGASGVAANATDSVYVAGTTESFGQGFSKIILLKFDPSGNLSWQKTWGGNGWDVGSGIALDSSGGIHIVGDTNSFGVGTQDVVLLKFDSSGNVLDQETWGVSQSDFGADIGTGIAVGPSGNVVATGFVDGGPPFTLTTQSGTVGTLSLPIGSANNSLPPPTLQLSIPGGSLSIPVGSQSYAGGPDVFFLEYDPPAAQQNPGTIHPGIVIPSVVIPSAIILGTLLAAPLLLLRRGGHHRN